MWLSFKSYVDSKDGVHFNFPAWISTRALTAKGTKGTKANRSPQTGQVNTVVIEKTEGITLGGL